jgi:UPF0271 protein
MGEGCGQDHLIMPFISSANIACGVHAGDTHLMKETIVLASKYGVAIGAHPSFPDRAHFGRLPMDLPPSEIYQLTKVQIENLARIAAGCNTALVHVKPHGALYNEAARSKVVAEAIVQAIHDTDPGLLVFGLSGSFLIEEAISLGLTPVNECFADRTYQADGSLTPRSEPGAMIEDPEQSLQQVLDMVCRGRIISDSGKILFLKAETICIHGDQQGAPQMAKRICQFLAQKAIAVCPPGKSGNEKAFPS